MYPKGTQQSYVDIQNPRAKASKRYLKVQGSQIVPQGPRYTKTYLNVQGMAAAVAYLHSGLRGDLWVLRRPLLMLPWS